MLSVDEVWSLIDRNVHPLPSVRVPLGEALGRRLAEEIRADADMPAFDRSAIDGYALPENAEPGSFRIRGEIKPGMPALAPPESGEAVRIFTGSALPERNVGLVMVEDTETDGDKVFVRATASRKHVRVRGSQARRGEVLLAAGAMVNPGAIALLASVGATRPLVSMAPRVVHLVTGGELVPADSEPPPGFIRDSNSPLVAALLSEAGAGALAQYHVSEDVAEAMKILEGFEADMLLVSGGASVGAYDGTAEILRRLGFVTHCGKVRSRPGKPLIFATRDRAAAFGLPGNPLSHFVCFHLFVRRALDAIADRPPQQMVRVHIDGERPAPDPRETWWPAKVRIEEERLIATPLPWNDSSDLTGLAPANALLRIGTRATNELVEALIFGSLGP
jgi:molybdopterin molybdotransferase